MIGTHDGHYFYTIGQRRGIEVNGGPWYVCDKDAQTNTIYLTHGFAGDDQSRREFSMTQLNWISDVDHAEITKVKLRHGPEFAQIAEIGVRNDVMNITLEKSDRGITAGQYGVLYTEKNICVGAGVIM